MTHPEVLVAFVGDLPLVPLGDDLRAVLVGALVAFAPERSAATDGRVGFVSARGVPPEDRGRVRGWVAELRTKVDHVIVELEGEVHDTEQMVQAGAAIVLVDGPLGVSWRGRTLVLSGVGTGRHNRVGAVALATLAPGRAPALRLVPTVRHEERVERTTEPSLMRWLANQVSSAEVAVEIRGDTLHVRPTVSETALFTAAEASRTPEGSVRYLDAISTLDQIRRYKAISMERLAAGPGERVLEIGSGAGGDLALLAERVGESGRVIGVDVSPHMVAEARERLRGLGQVEVHVGDIRALPVPDGSVDAVRIDRVLVHVSDLEAAFREVARVLRPGGRFVITEPDFDTLTISADDLDATRVVVHTLTDSFASGAVGRALAGPGGGKTRSTRSPPRCRQNRRAMADEFWRLREAGEAAAAAGRLDRSRLEGWRVSLEEQDRQGTFFCSLTGFGVQGRRS